LDALTLELIARGLHRTLSGRYGLQRIHLPYPRRVVLALEPLASDQGCDLHVFLGSHPILWLEEAGEWRSPDPLAARISDLVGGRRIVAVETLPGERRLLLRLDSEALVEVLCFGTQPRLRILAGAEEILYPGGQSPASVVGRGFPSVPEALRPWLERPLAALDEAERVELERLWRRSPGWSAVLVRELLWRAERTEASLSDVLEAVVQQARRLRETGDPLLNVYVLGESVPAVVLSAFDLEHLAGRGSCRRLPVLEAAREAATAQLAAEAHRLVATRRRELLRAARHRAAHLVARLETELARSEEAKTWRLWAQALLVHASRLGKGERSVRVPDPLNASRTLEIPVDPAKSPAENAAAYFRKAGREEKARSIREARYLAALEWTDVLERAPEGGGARDWSAWLGEARRRIGGWDPAAADLRRRAEETLGRIRVLLEEPRGQDPLADVWERILPASGLTREGSTPRARVQETSGGFHPRRFRTSDGWLVMVGRNNRENEILTHVVARPDDIWLHAQGVAGSHVLLRRAGRKDNPSRRTLEEAASLAARYSKARHSEKVPVIYTLKKYVRKPRKAPPGLVLCTREKTVMVAPADDAALRRMQEAARDRPAGEDTDD
jgi:hypothetical protein